MNILTTIRTFITAGQGVVVGMTDASEDSNPIELFQDWFSAAKKAGVLLPEAMSIATASAEGRPSVRTVLLKSFDEDGFVFFTNYGSRKGNELTENPHASILLHWAVLQRQIRVEGAVERVSPEESDAYFASRGRGSQLGAWASMQSNELDSRKALEKRVQAADKKYAGKTIPRPEHWGGFRIRPERIEFWQGRADRLHDRFIYVREAGSWTMTRQYP